MLKLMRGRPTLQGPKQLAVAVSTSWYAGETRIEVVASLNQALARWDLAPERSTLGAVRVLIDSVRSVASKLGNGGHLSVGIGDTIREDDTREVNVLDMGSWAESALLVLIVDDGGDVRSIRSTVTLSRQMERRARVFRVMVQEEL
jgi:hypothetical protein